MTKEEIIQKLQEIDVLQTDEEKIQMLQEVSDAIKELNDGLRAAIVDVKSQI